MIKGNSGDLIEIEGDFIIKSTNKKNSRLERQYEKQLNFKKYNFLEKIKPADIVDYTKNNGFSFKMPYYRALNCIDFFSLCSKDDIDQFIKNIKDIITQYEKFSVYKIVDKNIFIEKYNTVTKTIDNSYDEIFNYLLNQHEEIILPVGGCHGDLILSNMLFTKDKIILLDFLDTFIESPLQDIVKIKQDLLYKWSYYFYDGYFDKVKIDIIFNYINECMNVFFNSKNYYTYYNLFQFMNLIRLLPYIKDKNLYNIVDNEIKNIYEINSTNIR